MMSRTTLQPSPPIATIGIIGAGKVGSQIARAAVSAGYRAVIANSRSPDSLKNLVAELGPRASAAKASQAADAGDFVVIAVPLKRANDMPGAPRQKDGSRAPSGAIADLEGCLHPYPGAAYFHVGKPGGDTRAPCAFGVQQLPRGGAAGGRALRPVRLRHCRQQIAAGILAQLTRAAGLGRPRTPDRCRAGGQSGPRTPHAPRVRRRDTPSAHRWAVMPR